MLTLRRLDVADAPAVCALMHRAFAAQEIATAPPSGALRETPAGIAALIARGGGAAAEMDGVLAGSVLWQEKDGGLYFGRLSVDPPWRGQGIARRLVAAAENEARARGLPRVHLGVRIVLAGNRRLFASLGYTEGALGYHDGYAEPTQVAMEKWL